jgi:hypothetical protein
MGPFRTPQAPPLPLPHCAHSVRPVHHRAQACTGAPRTERCVRPLRAQHTANRHAGHEQPAPLSQIADPARSTGGRNTAALLRSSHRPHAATHAETVVIFQRVPRDERKPHPLPLPPGARFPTACRPALLASSTMTSITVTLPMISVTRRAAILALTYPPKESPRRSSRRTRICAPYAHPLNVDTHTLTSQPFW